MLSGGDAGRRVPSSALRAFMTDALLACGVPDGDAAVIAAAMLEADLTGADAHGVFRLAGYANLLRRGLINPRPRIREVERAPATALVDGDNGMGHLVMTRAAETAVAIARETGVTWVGVRGSNHAGAGAIYAAIPLAHGMVGIYGAVSGTNFMAPWGGAEPVLGTNPIAVAVPAGEEPPVVLDIATSVASNGLIRKLEMAGEPLPEGWVVDRADGTPITDARRIEEGVFMPIGGYKGAGLSLMIGILAGVLNGAAFGRDVRPFTAPEPERPSNAGQFVMALDVARFMLLDAFKAEVDRHARMLRTAARLPGVDAIRVPGEGRAARRAEREALGVPLPAALLKRLAELAQTLAIAPLDVQPRTGAAQARTP